MKQEQIKTLIDALAGSDLSELEYSENGSTLRLVKQSALAGLPPRSTQAPVRVASDAGEGPVAAQAPAKGPSECLAPLYGVVHLQSNPGEPPFVQPGEPVKAGQMLCVIEAMKVFNEVRAEHDCRVVEILVASGAEVEAGQALLRLDREG